MTKFNRAAKTKTRTVNKAGGEAFIESPKLQLVSLLLTSFVQDQFYRTENETVEELRSLITAEPDKKFVAKAAIYARNEFGMRSISHVVAGELANMVKGKEWTKNFFDIIVHRPDDMTEILSYYQDTYGKKEPNALKKGFASAFSRFDAYQLGKYRAVGKAVSLVDVVNLVHPKPISKNKAALKALVAGTLRSEKTWEGKLTKAGQTAKTEDEKLTMKKEVWVKLISQRQIGYFALLRNLRNIYEQSPEVLDEALTLLVDEKLIKKSLVLPFRFLTAIDEMEKLSGPGARKVLVALNKALDISTANVPKFEGETLVAIDQSGSMEGRTRKISSLFGAILAKSNNADVLLFSNAAQYHSVNPADSTLTIAQGIDRAFLSGGTDFRLVFDGANRPYSRVIILSDMQAWVGGNAPTAPFAAYKKKFGINTKVFSFDLAGYGTMQFPERDVYALAGYSEKIFDVLKMLEQDRNALIATIEKITL